VESNIRDNPAMSRFEMLLGDGGLAVAYHKVDDGRLVPLHTEVPQTAWDTDHDWRKAFSKSCDAAGQE
jgi:hypothetical protein